MLRKSSFIRSKALQLSIRRTRQSRSLTGISPRYATLFQSERVPSLQIVRFFTVLPAQSQSHDDKTNEEVRRSLEQSSLYFRLASKSNTDDSDSEQQVEHDEKESEGLISGSDNALVEPMALARALIGRILYAMNGNNVPEVNRLFQKSEDESDKYSLRIDVVFKICNFFCHHITNEAAHVRISDIYKAFKRYRILSEERDLTLDPKIIKTIVYALAKVPMSEHLKRFIKDLYNYSILQDSDFQQQTLPSILITLAFHDGSMIRPVALSVLRHIQEKNIEMTNYQFSKILEIPQGNGIPSVPRHLVLDMMLKRGLRPRSPSSIISLIESHYYSQFNSIGILTSLIESVVFLVKNPPDNELTNAYRLSDGLLEELMMSGARHGQSSFVLLVWDLMELLGYEPSEGMYESAVLSFCRSDKQDHLAFAAMTEMEDSGIKLSRAFLRTVSHELRKSPRRLDHTYNMLINACPRGVKISTSILNCLLAACAQEGFVDRSFAVFDQFHLLELQPNEQSFSFLMESLSNEISQMSSVLLIANSTKDLYVRNPTISSVEDMHIYIESIHAIINMMKEKNLLRDRYFLNHHVASLVGLGLFDQAYQILEEAIDIDGEVSLDAFEYFALQCVYNGDKDMAFRILSLATKAGYEEFLSHLSDCVNTALEKKYTTLLVADDAQT